MWIIAPGFFRVGAVRPRILLGVSRVIGSVARSYVQSGNASIFSLTVVSSSGNFVLPVHQSEFDVVFCNNVSCAVPSLVECGYSASHLIEAAAGDNLWSICYNNMSSGVHDYSNEWSA